MPDTEKNNMESRTPGDPVFYYSRERRLSHASPFVQDMNEGKIKRPGLAISFFGNKSNLVLFVTLLVILASFGLSFRFVERGMSLGGNTLTVAINREEGLLILNITKNAPRRGEAYLGAVEIAVYPVLTAPQEGEIFPVFVNRIFFGPVATETFRMPLPVDGTDFFVTLKAGEEQRSIRVNVTER